MLRSYPLSACTILILLSLDIKEFVTLYKHTDTIAQLYGYLQQDKKNILRLSSMVGSLDALMITALQQQSSRLQLVILDTQEAAEALYGDLYHVYPPQSVLLLPSIEEAENSTIEGVKMIQHKRTEIVHAIADRSNYLDAASIGQQQSTSQSAHLAIVVTHAAALMEKVLDPTLSHRDSCKLCLGQMISPEILINYLEQNQYTKVDFVYMQGQFSIRGSIIDVYATASLPYRIEFWSNAITDIRVFNPKNQRSFKSIKALTLLPHEKTSQSVDCSYIPFTACLPGNSVVWFKNKGNVVEHLQKIHESTDSTTIINQTYPKETAQDFLDRLNTFHQIEFGTAQSVASVEELTIDCMTEPQPHFQKRFDFLANDLTKNNQRGYTAFISATSLGQFNRLYAVLEDKAVHFTPLIVGFREGFIDHKHKIICYTDHQLFNRYYKPKSAKHTVHIQTEALVIQQFNNFEVGDYIVHSDYGIGRFSGLHTLNIHGCKQEVIRLIYKNNDTVFVNVNELYKISKYSSKDGTPPVIHKLGTSVWQNKKNAVKKQIKDIAKDLISLYAARKKAVGFAFSKDTPLDIELEANFCYEDTPDQAKAIAAVKADMERPHPMDRLVCGDVGFGKTEIAIRAAFKAALSGKQVAVLVPTTILALQHYNSFTSRLSGFPVCVSYLNRFKTKQEIQRTLLDTTSGKIDILIGTHKLLTDGVKFKDLGLLIIDEEQKFGVSAKEKLKKLRVHINTLTLSATPIPRTLHFSLMGARDLSILTTPPANRLPVKTKIQVFELAFIRTAIEQEIARGGQVFFVHNSVSSIDAMAQNLSDLLPTARICVAHGQMAGSLLEEKILQYIAGDYDVLISTSIIESGLDISNANTMIINNSHLLGLADLHQMRGRVGRCNTQAYCYLLIPEQGKLTQEAHLRLNALEEFSALGDGFKVAMRDLDIRGAGDLLGASQSGFIADVGFDLYCKILEEAVEEVKSTDFTTLFPKTDGPKMYGDCSIEVDQEAFLSPEYIPNDGHRMMLYTRLNKLKHMDELTSFREELLDRFGTPPLATELLLETIQLRWEAQRIGFQKLTFKDQILNCYIGNDFQNKRSDMWQALLQYIQNYPSYCRLKQLPGQLVLSMTGQTDMTQAKRILSNIGV